MKANGVAILALRLLAVYCFVRATALLALMGPVWMMEFRHSHSEALTPGAVALAFLPTVIVLVLGILLLVFAVPWGERLAGEVAEAGPGGSISFEQLQVLAFAVVGVIVFAGSLPRLFNSIYSVVAVIRLNTAEGRGQRPFVRPDWLGAIGTLLQAILGLALFFQARGFARFWRSLRTFATPKPPGTSHTPGEV